MIRFFAGALLPLMGSFFVLYAQEDTLPGEVLTVLTGWNVHNMRWIDQVQSPYSALYRISARAFRALDRRDRETALLKTAEDWARRREDVRRTLNELLGPWPEKTSLNARIVNVLQRDGFRVETLVFESLPGFQVTAALYIPGKLTAPAPGILYIPGHAASGFRAPHYQKFCLNLVHKGFVVLAYDPIDQGERLQQIDPETGSLFINEKAFPPYKIHSYVANQCYLSGVSLARYFIWDAIRGVDYLVSRPEVDGSRIGATGHSGGGNLAVFAPAIDDRVTVAVPSGWVTSYRRMLEINGLQDGEQNIFNGLTRGIDHVEWLLARAPKPTMLMTTTYDFFPIQGARETELEAKRAWAALGAPENFTRVEDDHAHGYTKRNCEAAFAFLLKHLGLTGDAQEREYPLFTREEFTVTPTGQVATALRSETVHSLNRSETQVLLKKLENQRKRPDHRAKTIAAARRLSGYESPQETGRSVYRGGYPRTGYRVDKHGLTGPDGSVVPVLLFLPDAPGPHPAVIYAGGEGKAVEALPGGMLESLVREGMVVAAIDVANTGETALPFGRANDYNVLFYTGVMAGGSVAALQAADLVRTVNWLQTIDRVIPEQIGLLAAGPIGPTALHAAVFEPDIRWLALLDAPVDYASMVMNRRYTFTSNCMVAGALTAYDLPDLAACVSPRRIAFVRPVDQENQPLTLQQANEALQYPMTMTDAQSLRIVTGKDVSISEITTWCSDAAHE